MRRYALRDDQWEKIEAILPGKVGDRGAMSGCYIAPRPIFASRSGNHFSRIVVPQAECVSPRLAVRCCGKAVALWTEDGGGLIVYG